MSIVTILAIVLYLLRIISFISILYLVSNGFILTYFTGKLRSMAFTNNGFKVEFYIKILLGILPVLDVRFCQPSRLVKTDYCGIKLLGPILIIMVNFGFISFIYTDLMLIIISLITQFVLFLPELMELFRLWLKGKAVFVEINLLGKAEPLVQSDLRLQHKKIHAIEYNYRNFLKNDLKRERIYLLSQLEKSMKPAFFDTIVFPLMVFFLGGTMQLLNIMSKPVTEGMTAGNVSGFGIFALFQKMPVYSTLADLKCRILVIEEMLENSD